MRRDAFCATFVRSKSVTLSVSERDLKIGERERERGLKMKTRTETLPTLEKETEQITRILMAVSHSTIKGYPHASISSTRAFEFVLKKIVLSDRSRFKVVLLHVQEPHGTCF